MDLVSAFAGEFPDDAAGALDVYCDMVESDDVAVGRPLTFALVWNGIRSRLMAW